MSDTDPPAARPPAARSTSAALAAALSFLVPGLGQAYAGQVRLALLFSGPILVVAALAALVGYTLGNDPGTLIRTLLHPGTLGLLIVLNLVVMGWRLLAIGQAGWAGPRAAARGWGWSRRGTDAVVLVLVVVTVAMHSWVGVVTGSASAALERIFAPGPLVVTTPPWGHLDPGVPEYRWDGRERINILLLGFDAGPGRVDVLSDTMLVVTVDPVTETAALISIPRDTGYVPLPDRRMYARGVYPYKINELSMEANRDPAGWCPDLAPGDDCGVRTLQAALGLYLGLNLQYVAWIDLQGFADLIDALGGVELCLPGTLADPDYHGPTWSPRRGIELAPGCQTYDGAHALAYARIRMGTLTLPDGTVQVQNDFLRAARQQEVLLALREKVSQTNLLVALPSMLEAIGRTVRTDFPRYQVGDLASLAPLLPAERIERVVLDWPLYVDLPTDPLRYYLLIPKRASVRDAMASLVGADALVGWYLATERSGP